MSSEPICISVRLLPEQEGGEEIFLAQFYATSAPAEGEEILLRTAPFDPGPRDPRYHVARRRWEVTVVPRPIEGHLQCLVLLVVPK